MTARTVTKHELLITKRHGDLAKMFNEAASLESWDEANEIWNAMYARVERFTNPNRVWSIGDPRDSNLIRAVNDTIDSNRLGNE